MSLKFNSITGKFDITVKDHIKLTNIGTNTHAQIDSHIGSTSNPHSVTLAQVGGTTDHGTLDGLADNDHTQYILHSLSTAANDFLVGSGSYTYIKKTLAETGAILEGDIDHANIQGTHNLTTDIDHDALTNFVANEHINWTSTASNFSTSGTVGGGAGTFTSLNVSDGNITNVGDISLDSISADGSTIVVNESGADVDFRLEGDNDANLIYTDAGTDKVGIGTSTPRAKLYVYGAPYDTVGGHYPGLWADAFPPSGFITGRDITALVFRSYVSGTAVVGTLSGVAGAVEASTGAVTTMYGSSYYVYASKAVSATTTTGTGSYIRVYTGGAHTITSGVGVYVDGVKKLSGTGGVTNAYGIYISNNIVGTSASYTLYSASTAAVAVSGNIDPTTAGTQNLGNATNYWGDLSYKTLTDCGCLGSFEEGVKMRDGSVVSNLEALMAIGVREDNETAYGVPMLDYRTMPESVYKPARDKNGNLYGRTEEDEPEKITVVVPNPSSQTPSVKEVQPADGAELTALVSIMIGAIRELDAKIAAIKSLE